jgi:hypothetical protein
MKLRSKTLVFATVLMAVCAVNIRAYTRTGDWSDSVQGLRGRLSVSEDKPFIGTRMIAVYLELENVSDVGNAIELYFDPTRSIVSRVVDENSNDVAQPPNGASIALPPPFWLAVPWDGSLRFRISVSGYGVYKNSGTQIQMNSGSWLIRRGDKRKFFLETTLVSKPPAGDRRRAWAGELKLPKILISGDKL